jgi:hypothetical protein
MVATPYRILLARDYPRSSGELPGQFQLMPAPASDSADTSLYDSKVPMHFRLSFAGLPENKRFLTV